MIHAFKFKNRYLVLDVESGAIHELDKPAYDVVRAAETGDDPLSLPYSKEDIVEILGELQELIENGAFDSPQADVPEGTAAPGVIKSMCLHIAHDCNLRCKYCFADTGEFHGERMLMDRETAFAALDFLMAHSGGRRHLEVDLFGGEPLMNPGVVRDTVAYGRELEKRFDKEIAFTITTNALALDEEMTEFINAEMHNVVLSLDGRKEVHDAARPTANGRGSYDLIVENAKRLVASRGGREYYVRGTFTSKNLDFTRDAEHIRTLGFDQISLEPVVLPPEHELAIREEHVKRVLDEYDALAEHYLDCRKNGKWFNFFHFMVDFSGGPCLRKRISGCGAGVEYVAVAPNGDIYPCHQFVGEPEFLMGSVHADGLNEDIRRRFAQCNVRTKEKCAACWDKYFCAGGCAANAYKYNGDIRRPYEITCEFEKKRTECAIGIFAQERDGE